jgi:hypothetical protein
MELNVCLEAKFENSWNSKGIWEKENNTKNYVTNDETNY